MARPRFIDAPPWEIIKPIALKLITNSRWRVDAIYDRDDLIQEAYIVYLKVASKYPGVTKSAFRSLFKSSLINWMHDQARSKSRRVKTVPGDNIEIAAPDSADPMFRVLLDEAPTELKMALEVIIQHPEKIKKLPFGRRNLQTLNVRMRRALGFDCMEMPDHTGFQFVQALKEHFGV